MDCSQAEGRMNAGNNNWAASANAPGAGAGGREEWLLTLRKWEKKGVRRGSIMYELLNKTVRYGYVTECKGHCVRDTWATCCCWAHPCWCWTVCTDSSWGPKSEMPCYGWLGHTDMVSGSPSCLALVQEPLQHTLLHSADRTMAHWLPVALPVHFRDTVALERWLCSSPVRLFPKQIAKNYSCSIPKRTDRFSETTTEASAIFNSKKQRSLKL